jgi:hypothetical protein
LTLSVEKLHHPFCGLEERSSSLVSYAGDRWFKSITRYQILGGPKPAVEIEVTGIKSALVG